MEINENIEQIGTNELPWNLVPIWEDIMKRFKLNINAIKWLKCSKVTIDQLNVNYHNDKFFHL